MRKLIPLSCAVLILAGTVSAAAGVAQGPTTSSTRTRKADARLKEAFTALYAGDPNKALRIASEYLKLHPSDVDGYVLAARAQLARQELTAAYTLLEKAFALDPRSADVLYFLGIAAGDLARREFDRLYTLAPEGARVHQLMARSLKLQDNYIEAAAEYNAALRVDPDLLEALLDFGELRREESNCEEAIALYERAQRVKPTYDGFYGLGVCLALQNEHSRAVEQFRQALKYDPQSASAEFELGSSLLRLGDAAASVQALERAVRLAPRMRQTYYVLGRAYQALGQSAKAQEAFARADALARSERAGDVTILEGKKPPRRVPVPPKIPQ